MRGLKLADTAFLGRSTNSFGPAFYGGLSAWWDAAFLGYADSTPIDNGANPWTDRSSSANNLIQATAANRPLLRTSIINGEDIVRFDGAGSPNNDFLSMLASINFAGDFAIFAVMSATADSLVFGNSGANRQVRYRVGTMSFYDGVTDFVSTALSTVAGTPLMLTWRRTASNILFRENKTSRTSAGASGAAVVIDQMGITNPFFNPLTGDVGEVVIYTQARSDAECDALYDDYFKPKWGLP